MAEELEDKDFTEALEAMLATGLIADTSLVAEIAADDENAGASDEDAASQSGQRTPQSPEELARSVELDKRVDDIYQGILTRAPEHKVQPSLERVEMCLDYMGNPHHSFRSIHITGTNGKTSTARMCEALVRESGLRTGRFTSPHLSNVRERICIDGQAISREAFIEAWEDVEPCIAMTDQASLAKGGPRMSFFEVFVVMAYAAFAAAPIDVAIVEVGMGGKWDATNVINSDVSILMPIGIDHEKWLGSSLEEIAEEKLGIVKENSTLVCAKQSDTVATMARERARDMNTKLIEYGEELRLLSTEEAIGGQMISIQTPCARYEGIPLALRGHYQGENAAVALAAVEAFFGGTLSGDIVEHAFMSVTSPGRLEVVRTSPRIILDACHNPHGATATAEALEEYFPGRKVAIMAMMADKDIEGVLGIFEPVFEEIIVTGMDTERAASAEDMAEIARDVFGYDRVMVKEDLLEAIDLATARAEIDDSQAMASPSVVICGSIHLIGHARDLLQVSPPDGA
ncbi:MAG: bifunctional folylpolyglutamate synthase/dihydrofolate synthase [Actinomycetaceae bacterium]|nr:bifunctional folylpolyglutamate synthase/dihydrofolate synthase [Actinomycetaceae bacterium]